MPEALDHLVDNINIKVPEEAEADIRAIESEIEANYARILDKIGAKKLEEVAPE